MTLHQKKILFVIDSLQTGGAEKSLLEIASKFKEHKPVICTLFSKNQDLKAEFNSRGIEVIELHLTGRLWLFQGIKKLKEVVAAHQPAIVHASLYNAELVTRLALSGKKQIHIGSFVNDSYAKERYQQLNTLDNLKLSFYRLLDAVTAQSVSHFTSITKSIASTNSKALHLNPDNITTIYRGRNIGTYQVHHPAADEKPFTYLAVARLLKRKGYLELIRAASILKNSHADFKILVAGEGPDRPLFEKTVQALRLEDNFEFLGTRKDVPDLLMQAHCFVFPSHYEGQGGALVEAMLAAKPIVATRIPVIAEQVTDGENAKLFELFNASDLASKMLWVYQNYDEAVAMGLKARKVAEEKFDVEKIAEQHEQLYSKLVKELRV